MNKKNTIFFKIILIFFLLLNTSLADIIKPSANIEPQQVVKIQLSALMKNDLPNKRRQNVGGGDSG